MNNKCKVVVSTFNNSKNNYGALFQSCGLYSFLTQLGYDVSYVAIGKRVRKVSKKRSLFVIAKGAIKRILLLPHTKKFKIREVAFKKFASETQNQIYYATDEELFLNPPKADVYVSGSDQVWNPVSMHEDLFLSYAPNGSKKISYAASMGNESIPNENKDRFVKYLKDYSAISVREDTVIDIVSPYVDITVNQNIDPVFLKRIEDWKSLEKKYDKLKFDKFILVYAIEWNSEFDKRLSLIKKEMGLPVVSINIGNIKKICANQVVYDASPNEFLYLLDKAECVVATSFHGIALSIIYNKPFLAISGSNKPTRINSLMRHFDIEIEKTLEYGADEFSKINKIIEMDRVCAKNYLMNAIEGKV
ncbi:MAG: polysaccharide pyruvyl transferase family protein [Clostridia bacterium]|nr:polysaccharide pyruvyl transferase family protein [Clostridia bacterium]